MRAIRRGTYHADVFERVGRCARHVSTPIPRGARPLGGPPAPRICRTSGGREGRATPALAGASTTAEIDAALMRACTKRQADRTCSSSARARSSTPLTSDTLDLESRSRARLKCAKTGFNKTQAHIVRYAEIHMDNYIRRRTHTCTRVLAECLRMMARMAM